jgi:hypothetical protein
MIPLIERKNCSSGLCDLELREVYMDVKTVKNDLKVISWDKGSVEEPLKEELAGSSQSHLEHLQ